MHKILPIFLLLLTPFTTTDAFFEENPLARRQSVAVTGQLFCGTAPASGTKVKLYDRDTFTPDDVMAEGSTDENGHFDLRGSESEVLLIDPKVTIYHNCNDMFMPCVKKMSIKIPHDYITPGPVPEQVFDVGTVNLAADEFEHQTTRDCFY